MEKIIEKVRLLCADHPFSKKLGIIPYGTLKTQIFKVLADRGISTFNLELITVNELAAYITSARLRKEGFILIDDRNETDVVREILIKMRQNNDLKYFSAIEVGGGLCDAITNTIHEIKVSGDPEWSYIKINSKKEDLERILDNYNLRLKEMKYADRADVLSFAIEELNQSHEFQWDYLLVFPGCRISPLESKLLLEICSSANQSEEVQNSIKEMKLSLKNESDVRKNWHSIGFLKTYGRYMEAKEVIRHIVRNNIQFDKVSIVAVNVDSYMQLFLHLTEKYSDSARIDELPITFGSGIPLSQTGPARLLMAILRWITDGYRVKDFINLFQVGAIKIDQPDENMPFGRTTIINSIKGSDLKWQRESYVPTLEKYLEAMECGTKRSLAVQWLIKTLSEKVFLLIPNADEQNRINTINMRDGLKQLLTLLSKSTSQIDVMGLNAVLEELDCIIENTNMASSQFCKIISERLKERRIMAESPQPGKLHLQQYRGAEWIQRVYTFLIGCDYDSFPSVPVEDPILLDEDRWPALTRAEEKIKYNLDDMIRFLSSIRGNLFVSYPYFDTDNHRRFYPSYIFTMFENLSKEEYGKIRTCEMLLSEDETAIDEEDVMIGLSIRNKKMPLAHEEINVSMVALSDSKLDPRNQSGVLSASSIQVFLQCRYRYYLQYILKLKQISDTKADILGWMSEQQIGNLYHEIFECFIKDVINDKSLIVDKESAVAHIMGITTHLLDRYEKELPVASSLHTEKQKKDIYENVLRFAQEEVQANMEYTPCHVEYPFGIGEVCQIHLADGRSVTVQGYIDRVDYCPSRDSYKISDYKTGSTFGYEIVGEDGLNEKKIQPVLYYLALRKLNQLPRIEKAEYRFVTRKGDYERVELYFNFNAEEKYLTELEKLLDDMASGKYDPVEEKKLCVYCPYSNVCRYYDDNGYGED